MTDLDELDLAGVPSVESMLAALAEENPNLRTVLRVMEARAAAADAEADTEAEAHAELLAAEAAAAEARAGRRQEAVARMAALLAELEELQARNEALAAALGACPECWGRQLGCSTCDGRGAPGQLHVDRQLFRLWVLPAVRAVRSVRPDTTRRPETSPTTDTDPPTPPTNAALTGATKDD